MRRLLFAAVAVVVTVLAAGVSPASAAQAGVGDATLQGRVLDPSGAPLQGARVTATPAGAPGVPVSDVTDQRGEFTLSLRATIYTLRLAADGFIERNERLNLADVAARTSEFVLEVAGVQETVSVEASGGYRTAAVTSATRTVTPLINVPQSVSVVTRALIAEQRMQSMADVVRYMPGVGMAQGEGNRDTPILRGNSSTADFFVDGIRDDVQYFRDLYNVERVEAVKGPNALAFGRGGVGGVINRVTRQADWMDAREVELQVGSWDNRRLSTDLGGRLNDSMAARVTGVYDNSSSYRNGVGLERYGVNPTVAFRLGPETILRAGYEYFHDERTADRGISSFNGRPLPSDPGTFFGNADLSVADATVHVLSSVVEHRLAPGVTVRNRVSYADYAKFYQNVFPGAVNATGTMVSLSAYNNATDRQNLFNQTDVIISRRTGRVGHTLLAGAELGRQETANFRSTGFFTSLGPSVASVLAPIENPTTTLPLEFRQNATDADNSGVAIVAAAYAQDQLELSSHVEAVVGIRFDSFHVDFLNNRTASELTSGDGLLSPRLGLIYKPVTPLSIYGSYSLTYLPRAGEQLSSLSLTNQALEPEEFRNYEVGAKWDIFPTLAFTAAVYRLDRGNVAVPDVLDPTRSVLVDAQRTNGLELALSGNITPVWSLIGGYALQDGEITRSISATAMAGAVLAQVPRHSFSLWNRYDVSSRWGIGAGIIHRGAIFTSTDNLVVLPGFTRVDGGVFYTVNARLSAQLNVENLFDEEYYASAHSNTNITPGSPRAFRMTLTTRF